MIVSEVREEEQVTNDGWAVEEPSSRRGVGGVDGGCWGVWLPRYIGHPGQRLFGLAVCGPSEMSFDEKTEA